MTVKGPKRTQNQKDEGVLKDPKRLKNGPMGGNHHFKALKHTAGKHANVPNGDEIGIVCPLKHSKRGPAQVLPAWCGNYFWASDEALSLLIGQKMPQKGSEAVGIQN
jgi:hypothetical protein